MDGERREINLGEREMKKVEEIKKKKTENKSRGW